MDWVQYSGSTPFRALLGTRTGQFELEECAMIWVLAALIVFGVAIWRLVRLEAQNRQQTAVIEELHQRVWQLEDLVAMLHQKRQSRPE